MSQKKDGSVTAGSKVLPGGTKGASGSVSAGSTEVPTGTKGASGSVTLGKTDSSGKFTGNKSE